jgi:hypothetical protein
MDNDGSVADAADSAKPVCVDGGSKEQLCGKCGKQKANCEGGTWGAWSACEECEPDASVKADAAELDGDKADSDAAETQLDATQDAQGAWDAGGDLSDSGPMVDSASDVIAECKAGEVSTQACENCGVQKRICLNGQWGPWSECLGQGQCAAGSYESGTCGNDLGACHSGARSRTCGASCDWGQWTECAHGYVGPSYTTRGITLRFSWPMIPRCDVAGAC